MMKNCINRMNKLKMVMVMFFLVAACILCKGSKTYAKTIDIPFNYKKAASTITYKEYGKVRRFKVNKGSSITFKLNGSKKVKKKRGIFYTFKGKKITWSSSNKKIATVDTFGNVSTKLTGSCYIKATVKLKVGKKTKKTSLRMLVTVVKKASLTPKPDSSKKDNSRVYSTFPGYTSYGEEANIPNRINVTWSGTKNNVTHYEALRANIFKEIGVDKNTNKVLASFRCAKWIADHVVYDTRGRDKGQTYQEAFDNGTAVCAGLTNTFNYLTSGLGIESMYVHANNFRHAFSIIKIDGKWYVVDMTGFITGYAQPSKIGYAYDTNDKPCTFERNYPLSDFLKSNADNGFGTPVASYNYPSCTDTRFDKMKPRTDDGSANLIQTPNGSVIADWKIMENGLYKIY